MEPIRRGIKANQTAALTAGSSSFSLLNANLDDALLIEGPEETPSASMDIEDEKSIAGQFASDADKTEPDDSALSAAAETLLDSK
jgi:hypothetical protein